MRRFLLIATLLLGCACPVQASEPVLEFLEGLRARRYFDTALYYLEQMEADPTVSAEVKATFPYERGQTLLQSAKDLANLDAQRQQLGMAQAAFETFVKAQPSHLLAGRANTARGQILLEKARVDIWDGDKPSNEGNRENFRSAARMSITQARGIFEQARVQHESNWKKFPAFIPEDQPAQRAERNEAEELYIRAQLDLAQCTYWEAQTYDKGTKDRITELRKASTEFEQIHQQYRSQLGGLFARIWQGKCFEEQGDTEGIRIALGIYGEILEHDGTTASMRNLKDRALRYRLICLNYPDRHDYQLVIQEAEAWLKDARDRARTDVGMGIQWELCRAQEAIGMDRNIPEGPRKAALTQALTRARAINRYPGELKTNSSAMIQRLLVALNRDPSDPKDFDTAYGNGGHLYEQVATANATIRKLQSEGKTQEATAAHAAMMATAGELTRMYDLALRLATPANDQLMVNIARLRLSYGYLLQQRFFDAAVVADEQMLRYAQKSPEVAREAGFLAMTAFDNAYANAPSGDRKFETEQVIKAANKICDLWPDSDRANDARNTVAKIYWNDGDLLTAAEWWEKIPVGTTQYGDSQVRAGKAYWRQYVLATARKEGDQSTPEELNRWKEQAVKHLTIGLEDAEKNTPAGSPLPDDLIGAKLTLVSIRNLEGNYQSDGKGPRGALELLTKDPHPVLKAVDVAKGETRPKDPGKAKSRQMASFAYQQLLRWWVGLKNLEEARKARLALEAVAGGEDDAALTQVFVDFGRELEQELTRLKASGDTKRLDDVRAGFESFLNDLFQRKDGQTFYSLLWIAETYSSLADASSDNQAKETDFYQRAATAYQTIIQTAASKPDFATAPQLLACKLRLMNCLREQKKFPEAEVVLTEVLKATPNAPDAQFQAAELYEDWGNSGNNADREKFKVALYGSKTPIHIWGWTYASQSLQQAAYNDPSGRMEQLLYDARYRLAEAERKYGLSFPDKKEGREHLERARVSITGFQRVSKRWTDEEFQRFNTLYKGVLKDMGEPVVDLPRELIGAELPKQAVAGNSAEAPVQVATPTASVQPKQVAPAAAPAGNNTLLILGILVLGGAAAAGLYFMAANQKKPVRESLGKTSDGDGNEFTLAAPGPIAPFDGLPNESFVAPVAAVKKATAAPNPFILTDPATTTPVSQPGKANPAKNPAGAFSGKPSVRPAARPTVPSPATPAANKPTPTAKPISKPTAAQHPKATVANPSPPVAKPVAGKPAIPKPGPTTSGASASGAPPVAKPRPASEGAPQGKSAAGPIPSKPQGKPAGEQKSQTKSPLSAPADNPFTNLDR